MYWFLLFFFYEFWELSKHLLKFSDIIQDKGEIGIYYIWIDIIWFFFVMILGRIDDIFKLIFFVDDGLKIIG